jgi:outer membrane protein TolC
MRQMSIALCAASLSCHLASNASGILQSGQYFDTPAKLQSSQLTLPSAIDIALRENRTVRAAYVDRTAQKYDLVVARSEFMPKIVMNASSRVDRPGPDRQRTSNITPEVSWLSPLGTRFTLTWSKVLNRGVPQFGSGDESVSLAIAQPLLRGAGLAVATAPLQTAELTEANNVLGLKAQISQIVSQVIVAYRELIRAQLQVSISRESLQRSQDLLKINEGLIKAGRMAAFDIVQTEAEVAGLEIAVEEASNQLSQRKMELLILLGVDIASDVTATDDVQTSYRQIDLATAKATALRNQPEYAIQLNRIKQMRINVAVAANNRLWDFSMIAGATRSRNLYEARGEWYKNNYIGVQLSVPLNDLTLKQNYLYASGNLKNYEISIDQTREQLVQNVSSAVRDIDVRWRQLNLASKARELSLKKVDLERKKLALGRSSNFQVLTYETDFRNSENTLLNAKLAYLNAQTELDLLLGTTLETWGYRFDEK